MERGAPVALAALAAFASGENRSPENAEIVFFGLHLLAEKRETEALAPLLAVALEGEPLYDMIGDATGETLSAILISLYDGDPGKLKQNHRSVGGRPMGARGGAGVFRAGSWPAATSPARSRARLFAPLLRDAATARSPPVWYGWQGCVALLGLIRTGASGRPRLPLRLCRQGRPQLRRFPGRSARFPRRLRPPRAF